MQAQEVSLWVKTGSKMLDLRFTKFLNKFNFEKCEADKCVFIGKFKNDVVYLALFVDDSLVASKNRETLKIITRD